jgi:predicted MarR family transcription regulator
MATIPAQTDVRIRGQNVTAKVTASGRTTCDRFRVLCDELADNPSVPESMQKAAAKCRTALCELSSACGYSNEA